MVLMKRPGGAKSPFLLPGALAMAALAALAFWLGRGTNRPLVLRAPGAEGPRQRIGHDDSVLVGKLLRGDGQPSTLPGAWPQFRGPNRDAICKEATHLARAWQPSEPRELWAVDVGEGFAALRSFHGRVYLMDYDRDKRQDALRCLSLEDGRDSSGCLSCLDQAQSWHVAHCPGGHGQVGCRDGAQVPRHLSRCRQRPIALGITCPQFGRPFLPWYTGQCPLIRYGGRCPRSRRQIGAAAGRRKPNRQSPLANPQPARLENDPSSIMPNPVRWRPAG